MRVKCLRQAERGGRELGNGCWHPGSLRELQEGEHLWGTGGGGGAELKSGCISCEKGRMCGSQECGSHIVLCN